MTRLVLLDSGPLGKYANPKANAGNTVCRIRVEGLLADGVQVKAPRIAVYENRRKLIHLQLADPVAKRLERFDRAVSFLGLLPMTDEVMQLAERLWGASRHRGDVTAPDAALDCDVIIAAHALLESERGSQVEIATTNTADISKHFKNVLDWDDLVKIV